MIDANQVVNFITDSAGFLVGLVGVVIYGKHKLLDQKLVTTKYVTETELINAIRQSLSDSLTRIDILNDEIVQSKILIDAKNESLFESKLINNDLTDEVEYLKGRISLLVQLINRLSDGIDKATDELS